MSNSVPKTAVRNVFFILLITVCASEKFCGVET